MTLMLALLLVPFQRFPPNTKRDLVPTIAGRSAGCSSVKQVGTALAGPGATGTVRTQVLIAFHSETGNTEKLARASAEGASRVTGVTVTLKSVAEARAEEILAADGILVGAPVQWGGLSAEAKRFLDRVGQVLTEAKSLDREGRTAGAFVTGGAPSSGKELARISILAAFLNMRFVVLGGVAEDGFGTLGAQATTGPADPGVSQAELEEARRSGERFARLTHALHAALASK